MIESLAQVYLKRGRATQDDRAQETCHRVLMSFLAPRPGATVLELQNVAERFVFESDPTENVRRLIESGQIEKEVVAETARLVSRIMWIEWVTTFNNGRRGRVGYLVGNHGGKTVMYGVLELDSGNATPFLCVTTVELPAPSGSELSVHYYCRPKNERSQDEILGWYYDAIEALFMLCVPRASEIVIARGSRSINRKRERRGEEPFLEYRNVKMIAGAGPKRYAGVSSSSRNDPTDEGGLFGKRKLHEVIGHFRTYREGREKPHVTFVPEHWRGDPTKGIVLHRRSVQLKNREDISR